VTPGKVYAVEIDQGFLDRIKDKTRQAGVSNVVTVLGAYTDPKLPVRDVDVALFHDVLHHIKERAAYLKATAAYLKPDGRIAVVELPPDGSHKDEPDLVVTKDQVKAWMADAGLVPKQEFDGIQGKWFVVYGRR
jgi:SAM-dependent methyltransferase